jgi:hypothetical protein
MKLYVLRVTIAEYYDDPDDGKQHVCDRYDDIRYSFDRGRLDDLANDLLQRLDTRLWSERWRNKIRAIWPGYDDDVEVTTVTVVDITNMVVA